MGQGSRVSGYRTVPRGSCCQLANSGQWRTLSCKRVLRTEMLCFHLRSCDWQPEPVAARKGSRKRVLQGKPWLLLLLLLLLLVLMNTNERTPNCTNIDRCRQGLLNVLKHHFLFRKLPLACCLLLAAFCFPVLRTQAHSLCVPIEDTHESLNSPEQVKQQLNLPRYVYSASLAICVCVCVCLDYASDLLKTDPRTLAFLRASHLTCHCSALCSFLPFLFVSTLCSCLCLPRQIFNLHKSPICICIICLRIYQIRIRV